MIASRFSKLKNSRYQMSTQEIGRGAFANVYPGRDTQNNTMVAVKQIDSKKHSEHIQRIDQECQLHQSLPKNQHILQFIDNFNEKDKIYIITELCEFGDLEHFVEKFNGKILPEDVARLFTYQILLGFLALYDLKIFHRDLKLQNILINKNFECKIADFGLAKSCYDLGQTQVGTPLTMAPEILFSEQYDQQCDVWSFGCIIYAMTHGKYPFLPKGPNKRRELEQMVMERRLVFDNPNLSQECIQFIDRSLQTDPQKRIKFEEMFDEPWLQQCFKDDFNQSIVDQYLKNLTYKEVHVNHDFARGFGVALRNCVDVVFQQHFLLLENAYLNFINKTNQTSQEKKVLYILNLLITKMCFMNIEFSFKDKVSQIPLTQNSITMLKSIIGEENFKKSKTLCESSSIDLPPLLQTLNSTLLQIAQHELQQMEEIEIYKKEFVNVISLIEILTHQMFGLPLCISVNIQNSTPIYVEQIENISIKEAYIDIDQNQEDQECFNKNHLSFNCSSKSFCQNPEEKQTLEHIKSILGIVNS